MSQRDLYGASYRVKEKITPADLLARRPDLASAEQALVAAEADIAQARTAYFPRLALTASLGQQSQDLSNLFTPNSLFWSMLGNLTQPIFRAGAIDSVLITGKLIDFAWDFDGDDLVILARSGDERSLPTVARAIGKLGDPSSFLVEHSVRCHIDGIDAQMPKDEVMHQRT